MKEKRMFYPDLFTETENGPRLIAGKCTKCGKIRFPQTGVCPNCLNESSERVYVGEKGKLFSFTTTYGPVAKLEPPFTIGYVDLPEGVRIFAQLELEQDFKYEIGMDMELETADLWEEEDAVVTGYRYRAAGRK